MCVVCGCGAPEGPTAATGATQAVDTASAAAGHLTVGAGGPAVDARGDLHYGRSAAHVSVPGMSAERAIRLEADVLGANDRVATANRAHFAAHGVAAYNFVSSPGSGKTTLLCATIDALRQRTPAPALAVIEGDQQTTNDADRIRATGAPAIQVNTGNGCHLDAPMVAAAFARLPLHSHSHAHDHLRHQDHDARHGHGPAPAALLFIENVGNLVCPAMWDLGERAKVAILSVTEGEDKPIKYPHMFAAARLMVLHKVDLLPHLDFDVARCIEYARRVNPGIEVLQVSARSGQGMDAWIDWLLADAARAVRNPRHAGETQGAHGDHAHPHGDGRGHAGHGVAHAHGDRAHPQDHGASHVHGHTAA